MSEQESEQWSEPIYQPSGLICEKCGYDDSIQCRLWNDEIGDDEPSEILCGKHAAEYGYCCCCGDYCAGMTSFDFHHPGYCDNCYHEIVDSYFEDNDDDY